MYCRVRNTGILAPFRKVKSGKLKSVCEIYSVRGIMIARGRLHVRSCLKITIMILLNLCFCVNILVTFYIILFSKIYSGIFLFRTIFNLLF